MVTTARELARHALQIVRTRDLEEVSPSSLDVVHFAAWASSSPRCGQCLNVPVARHEVAVVAVDVGEGSKAVVLHLEEPIGMIEGLRETQEGHGPEWRGRLERERTDVGECAATPGGVLSQPSAV